MPQEDRTCVRAMVSIWVLFSLQVAISGCQGPSEPAPVEVNPASESVPQSESRVFGDRRKRPADSNTTRVEWIDGALAPVPSPEYFERLRRRYPPALIDSAGEVLQDRVVRVFDRGYDWSPRKLYTVVTLRF